MARYTSQDVQFSKTMSYILRHGAEKEGIEIRKDGFVKLDDLFKNNNLKKATKEDILRIVANCPKQRFHVEYFDNESTGLKEPYIRANQGHSLAEIQVDLKEITDNDHISQCIHGTFYKFWQSIKSQGLGRMSRQHIHFSEDLPGSKKVISGARNSCEVAVFIDISKAMKDGIKFYRSANNVILSPGDQDGFINTKYFLRALDLKKNVELTD